MAQAPQDQSLIHIIATRLDALHGDMQEIKGVQKDMAAAFAKLILIEERQANTANAQDRAFKVLEKLDAKIDTNLSESKQAHEKLEARVDVLEQAAPMNAQARQWVIAAVYGAASLAVMFVAKSVGLI